MAKKRVTKLLGPKSPDIGDIVAGGKAIPGNMKKGKKPNPPAKKQPLLVAPTTMTIEKIQPQPKEASIEELNGAEVQTNVPKKPRSPFQSVAPPDYRGVKRWPTSPNLTKGELSQLNKPLSKSCPSLNITPSIEASYKSVIKSANELKNLSLEQFLSQLRTSIENHTINNIINIIADNLELINQELEGDKKDEMEELLKKAAGVQNKEGNTIFHILAARKNLSESEKEIKILELFNNLGDVMPNAMEVKNKAGETPLNVAEGSCNNPFANITRIKLTKLPKWNHHDTNTLQLPTSKASDSQTEPKTPPNPAPRLGKKLDKSDSDSGLDSSLSPTDSVVLSISPGSSGTLSRAGSLNSVLSAAEEEPQLAAEPDPVKEKPAPIVMPALDTQSKKEQTNGRKSYASLTAGCAILAVCCFAAAGLYFMSEKKINPVLAPSSTVVIGALCVMGAVFAIAAWYLTPSSELSSANVTPTLRTPKVFRV